ncbi:hypothetical protein CAPTEDRAFT_228182 [Capitella teleta]|uniref:Uncharacterized protein n=1 Tax=Capitella teleta TaxID=283909 RepID=R7UQ73_CAPTE|nr:hypothetical protein CAPTEDRAFT_228182 [Capitella teleta]|eukprot:ELU05546.1 hypothetical protein CAPTEDRAFT_228182 [Capitella teleta]
MSVVALGVVVALNLRCTLATLLSAARSSIAAGAPANRRTFHGVFLYEMGSYGSVVTPVERSYLKENRFEDLIREQYLVDAEIDQQLVHQEEELRMEEEAYYEAKREAARVAKMQRMKEKALKEAGIVKKGGKAWVGDDESDWEIAGGEDDFEMFLESVKARSLAARTRALPAAVAVDAASEASSKDDRSRTEASSLDLEWEHEEGMTPVPREKKKRFPTDEGHLSELAVKPMLVLKEKQDSFCNDFEWDSDVGGNGAERGSESQTLLPAEGSHPHADDAER